MRLRRGHAAAAFPAWDRSMNRWLLLPLVALVATAGLVFAAQNAGEVTLVLFGPRLTLPLGVLVLGSLFAGCLAGGVVLWFGVILPLRIRLRQGARRDATARGEATA
jgi:uncharacterized integral membrane protein